MTKLVSWFEESEEILCFFIISVPNVYADRHILVIFNYEFSVNYAQDVIL